MSKLHLRGAGVVAILLALPACDSPVVEPAAPGDLPVPAYAEAGDPSGQHAVELVQNTSVNWHAQQQLISAGGNGKSGVVDGASARLVRHRNGISYRIYARELTPGHAYSLWLVVINNPGACASTPCTAADILTNPATDSQVRLGGIGTVAGASGRGNIVGRANVGPLSGWLDGRSLGDPFAAEVHLVINDHGPKLPDYMPAMITTYRAGCSDSSPFPGVFPQSALADGMPGPNTCLLYQAAIFQAS